MSKSFILLEIKPPPRIVTTANHGAHGKNLEPYSWLLKMGVQDFFSFMDFNPYTILAGLIFGTIGWGAFSYGKRLDLWQPRVIGVGLMVYPYVFTNPWLLWGIGVGLMVLLWFYHDE